MQFLTKLYLNIMILRSNRTFDGMSSIRSVDYLKLKKIEGKALVILTKLSC